MTQPGWSERLVRVLAAELKRWREEHGLSAQALADRTAAIGHEIPRSVLANLESGRRGTLSIPELFVLAQALEVPPSDLLLPLGHAEQVEILPGVEASPAQALDWVTGRKPMRGHLWKRSVSASFYVHSEAVAQATVEQRAAREIRERGGDEKAAEQHDRYAARERAVLWKLRERLLDEGITPPDLPEELAVYEEVERR